MNEQFKKLTEEIKSAMLAQKDAASIVEQTKAASDSGSFEFIISTSDVDRQGDVIDQNGWDLTHYKSNPIVLWAHDYYAPPIGVTDDIALVDGKLVAKGRFAPTEFAQEIRALYEAKILRTASVGFIPKEFNGPIITKAELLEWSIVPVPANPMALSLAKELNLDAAVLMQKGLFVKSDEAAPAEEPQRPQETTPQEPKQEETETVETGEATETEKKPEGADVEDIEVTDEKGVVTMRLRFKDGTKSEPFTTTERFVKTLDDYMTSKAGRVLSEKNRTTIKTAIEGMKASIAALDELLTATDEGGEGKQVSDGASPKQRSKDAGSSLLKDLDTYFEVKKVLRLVNTVTSESLAKINAKARK